MPMEIALPHYPAPGGLLPFLEDFGGGLFYWVTKGDPERWPVLCALSGQVRKLAKGMTLPKLLREWLENKPRAIEVLGDLRTLPPERTGPQLRERDASRRPSRQARQLQHLC